MPRIMFGSVATLFQVVGLFLATGHGEATRSRRTGTWHGMETVPLYRRPLERKIRVFGAKERFDEDDDDGSRHAGPYLEVAPLSMIST
mgnify:FL=1